MSRRHAVVAAVLLAASGLASAYVRETTAMGDPTSGRCLWWGARQVQFKVNATSAADPPNRTACAGGYCAPCLDATAAAAAVTAALPTWNAAQRSGDAQACTDFGFASGGTTTATAVANDGLNLVVFRTGWCSSASVVPLSDPCRATVGACAALYNCWEHDPSGTIGLTTITFSTATGEILDADIELHGWDGNVPANGYYLTCATSPTWPACGQSPWGPPPAAGCTATDVASLALHEAGHVIGLDHTCQYAAPNDSCTAGSVMQPVIRAGTTRRSLDADDVDGICRIYPSGGATLTCGSAPAKSGGGCATGEGAGLLALVGAALAARRARRRA